ncbi:MAG: hypothetical protein IPJ41_06765 [Phycisphaerales bacterium]|nr:hypothetical protein [Phycisphaerales bacterium]
MRRHRWRASGAALGLLAVVTMAVLGLVAREQAARARLSEAVRDARTLESHRVQMSEARSIARDNLMLGERTAWDVLLDPEPILVAGHRGC